MNEIYFNVTSVAAKRLDCDNTVRVYTSLAYTIQYDVIKNAT